MIKIKESEIQKQIIGYLQHRKDLFFHRSNNTGLYNPTTKGFMKTPPGFVAGMPDIEIFKNGRYIGVELKRDEKYKKDSKGGKKGEYKHKQTRQQIEVEKEIKKHGFEYYVIRSLEELINVL